MSFVNHFVYEIKYVKVFYNQQLLFKTAIKKYPSQLFIERPFMKYYVSRVLNLFLCSVKYHRG